MASDPNPGLYSGTVRIRPTRAGKGMLIGIGLLLWQSLNSYVSYGFVLILLVIAVGDALVSRYAMSHRDLSVRPVTIAATAPNSLGLEVSAPAGLSVITITPLGFSLLDPAGIGVPVEIGRKTCEAVPVAVAASVTPHSQRFVRFILSTSVLGFVEAQADAICVSTELFHSMPLIPVVEKQLSISVDDVGRLRTYQPGDRRSRVAWATTARTGSLHVRASSVEEDGDVTVVLNLGSMEEMLEAGSHEHVGRLTAASVSAGAVIQNLMDQGVVVTLRTVQVVDQHHQDQLAFRIEHPGAKHPVPLEDTTLEVRQVEGVVHTRDELLRRLARAEPGPVASPPGPHLEISLDGPRMLS